MAVDGSYLPVLDYGVAMAVPPARLEGTRMRWVFGGALGGILGAIGWLASVSILFFMGFGGFSRSDGGTVERWADQSTIILFILGPSLVLFPLGVLSLRNPPARVDRALAAAFVLGVGALVAAIVLAADRPTQCMFVCYRGLGTAGSWPIFAGLALGALTNILTGVAIEMSAPPGRAGRGHRVVRTLLVVGGALVLALPGGLLFALVAVGGAGVCAAGDVAAVILISWHARSW